MYTTPSALSLPDVNFHYWQSHIRYRRAGWYRNRVAVYLAAPLSECSRRMTAHSSHLTLEGPTCIYPCLVSSSYPPRTHLARRRVCQVELHGDKTFTLKQQKYRVSEALKTGEATVLFGTLSQSSRSTIQYLIASFIYSLSGRGNFHAPRRDSTPCHLVLNPLNTSVVGLGGVSFAHTPATTLLLPQITLPIPWMPFLHQVRNHTIRTRSMPISPPYLWVLRSRSLLNKQR